MPPFQDETDALEEEEEGAVEGEEEEEEGEDLFGDNIERCVRASYLCYSTDSGILPPPTHTHNPNLCGRNFIKF